MFAIISSRIVIANRETYDKNCTSNSVKQTTEVIKKNKGDELNLHDLSVLT